MNAHLCRVLGEAYETETRSYTISALPEHLDELERLFGWINSTASGHSGSAQLYVDGDGAARFTIKRDGKEIKEPDDSEIDTSKKPEFSVSMESLSK